MNRHSVHLEPVDSQPGCGRSTANGERAVWYQTPTMPDGSGYRLRADANGDDCVDDADLGIVLEYYGCEAPWTGACAGGEAADLAIVLSAFGEGC